MAKQFYKAVYFSDYSSDDSDNKSVTLAFSESETPYYSKVKNMTTQEIKELIGIETFKQLSLFADKEERSINQTVKRLIKQNLPEVENKKGLTKRDVTFVNSKTIPFQRWYPYIEGYSPDFIETLIEDYNISDFLIYEPFAGTGTTIFASDKFGLSTVYTEVNPLLQFLIETKKQILKANEPTRMKLSKDLYSISDSITTNLDNFNEDETLRETLKIIATKKPYFSNYTLSQVLKLRSYIDIVSLENKLLANALSLAVMSVLLQVSFLKKAGDVRFKTKKDIAKGIDSLKDVLPNKIKEIAEDVANMDNKLIREHELILSNAKNIGKINRLSIGAIITSPPYLNGTNYFRNTKIELWFLRFIVNKNDLRIFRDKALTSGINDVRLSGRSKEDLDILSKSEILTETLTKLQENAYDDRIPVMALHYFKEMYSIFKDCRKHLISNAKVLIDIGDSIFGGVHIQTDKILIEILNYLGYKTIDYKILRKRRSRNQQLLSQSLLVFEFDKTEDNKEPEISKKKFWLKSWNEFKNNLPHQEEPFSKRNWGHRNHSICSYQGKLKPSIAHHLVKTFVPESGTFLDPFSGVGTIPFEGALSGKKSYGIDISLPAYYISQAKVSVCTRNESYSYINKLEAYILNNFTTTEELKETKNFGLNKTIFEYYHIDTLNEILLARRFLKIYPPKNPSEMLVISSLLHILHGNRPYALSRRSHPIVPYAPQGEFIYKNLIEKLKEKVDRSLNQDLPLDFKNGTIFNQDITNIWPQEIDNLDAIITSPPFFDSTRFYSANWLRIWFTGWSAKDFKHQPNSFIDERQKNSFSVYESIFRQARERLKNNGVCVLHLGKSNKCDMAEELQKVSKKWFKKADLFDESVAHCEKFGIKDVGTVTSHQYLILI